MVKVLIGDLFTSNAQTLVNTVNTVGVMGKGVALEFRRRFPDMYEDYVRRCRAGQVRLGRPYLYRRLVPPWILNFPTKDHWRSVAQLDAIVAGLEYLERHYEAWGIESLAVPRSAAGRDSWSGGSSGPRSTAISAGCRSRSSCTRPSARPTRSCGRRRSDRRDRARRVPD